MAGTALVTGGGTGIGRAIAAALLDRGWSVSLCGRDGARLERVSAELAAGGGGAEKRIHAARADVSVAADVERWVGEAAERFGPPSLLVNNAGIYRGGEIATMPEADWDRVLDINVKGAFLCTRAALPGLRGAGGGMVVNISSISGKQGMAGSSAYCASKFAMIGLTESLLAEERANGIRATAICPGYVDTPMTDGVDIPRDEMIRPEDIAATVLYLLDLSPVVVVREIVIERTGS